MNFIITFCALICLCILNQSEAALSTNKQCYKAKTCIHDNIEKCGVNSSGSPRRFLDTCDIFEFNCLKNTDYIKSKTMAECTHLPSLYNVQLSAKQNKNQSGNGDYGKNYYLNYDGYGGGGKYYNYYDYGGGPGWNQQGYGPAGYYDYYPDYYPAYGPNYHQGYGQPDYPRVKPGGFPGGRPGWNSGGYPGWNQGGRPGGNMGGGPYGNYMDQGPGYYQGPGDYQGPGAYQGENPGNNMNGNLGEYQGNGPEGNIVGGPGKYKDVNLKVNMGNSPGEHYDDGPRDNTGGGPGYHQGDTLLEDMGNAVDYGGGKVGRYPVVPGGNMDVSPGTNMGDSPGDNMGPGPEVYQGLPGRKIGPNGNSLDAVGRGLANYANNNND